MARERQNPELRPSPDALLEAARRADGRTGKLKIFVGAAPGVGKTYEMLQSAHAKRKAGVDVVVGVVETHGRVETEALLKGLEVLPRKRLTYKDQTLEEIPWDEWFDKFDANRLALVYQEETKEGRESRFAKLVSRDNT